MRLTPVFLGLILAACGGATSTAGPTTSDGRATSAVRAEPVPSEAPRASRHLGRQASFGDLVAAARALDERRDQDSDAGCLVRRSADGVELSADLAVSVRPLPDAGHGLGERLATVRGPARVLTRYGSYGEGDTDFALVAINTALPPRHGRALVLVLTREGLYARRTDLPYGETTASRIEWVLGQLELGEFDLVAVTADASVRLDDVLSLLERLPAELAGRVVLASPLAAGTRLPEARSVSAEGGEGALCPDGLPLLADEAPFGDLSAGAIRAGLSQLTEGAALCVGTSGAGAGGGVVRMAVRIEPDGRVRQACATADETGDPGLRACLVRAAQELSFDAPGGYVDFEVPLRLEPGRAQRQVPVCR